jgi:hypothetical protein
LNSITSAGAVYIYEKNANGNWNETEKIVASDRAAYDSFGSSVSISGDYVIVGAPFEDEDENGANTLNDAGSAYIFGKNSIGVWSEAQKIVASDRSGTKNFGSSLAISGAHAVVGVSLEDDDANGANPLNNAGAAYFFGLGANDTWSEITKAVASDRAADDEYGNSVAISGDIAIVGAHLEDEDASGGSTSNGAGSVYFFGGTGPAPIVAFDTDINAPAICPDATEWLVPIDVATIPSDIGAVSLVLDYDNTKMTYDTIIGHANMDAANNPIIVSDNNGKITIGWIKTSGATISNETLLTLKFVPAGGAADFSAIAGQTADFTWDKSSAGNCQLAGTLGNVMTTTFNDLTGAIVNTAPTAGLTSDASNNTTLCAGDNVTFTATGGTSYSFDVNGGTAVAGTGTNGDEFSSATLANGDIVTVTVTDANGCSSTATLTMVVNPLPTAGLTSDATNNTTLCAGDNVTFTATGGTSYSFDVNGGTATAGTGTNSDEFSSATLANGDVVTVTVTDANGCSSTATLTMVVNPLPTVGISSDDADNTICAGDAVTFTGSGATSYSFDVNGGTAIAGTGTNGDEFSSATLANGDVVTVTGTDANGCDNTASITMTVSPSPTAGLTSDKTHTHQH